MLAAGSHRHAKGFGRVQLPPSVLTFAPSEGTGKAKPGEKPAVTGLLKKPPWRSKEVSQHSPLPGTRGPSPLLPHSPRPAKGPCFTHLAYP